MKKTVIMATALCIIGAIPAMAEVVKTQDSTATQDADPVPAPHKIKHKHKKQHSTSAASTKESSEEAEKTRELNQTYNNGKNP